MASSRHFSSKSNQTEEEVLSELLADITNSRNGAKQLRAAGQHRLADSMDAAANEYLDEYNALKNRRWNPKHA
ncbi:hypothetical protein [Streptomyces sp. NPDC059708]|uniref:hypothetical protein n=1 Tax=Streptomyces sp. NPDC059708 TaxID=3346916 RepID=UPI0036803E72